MISNIYEREAVTMERSRFQHSSYVIELRFVIRIGFASGDVTTSKLQYWCVEAHCLWVITDGVG